MYNVCYQENINFVNSSNLRSGYSFFLDIFFKNVLYFKNVFFYCSVKSNSRNVNPIISVNCIDKCSDNSCCYDHQDLNSTLFHITLQAPPLHFDESCIKRTLPEASSALDGHDLVGADVADCVVERVASAYVHHLGLRLGFRGRVLPTGR